MTYPNSSTDATVLNFIAAQNGGPDGRGSTTSFAPAILNNGIAGPTTDNVIGFSSLAQSAPAISMGSGFNTIIIDGQYSMAAAASGSPDTFYFYVNPSGDVVLFDNNTHASVDISGVSFVIFDGAVTNTNGSYQSMYYVGNANQTEITELYTAAFGRQPDLGGVEYYMNELKAGLTIDQIASQFQASPEFQARYGTNVSDAQYITNLYENVLHRAPSTSELTYYESALTSYENGAAGTSSSPSWSRTQELLNFTNSSENQANVSGFVVNTASPSVSFDLKAAPGTETALQVLTAAETTGVVDTNLINPASLPTVKEVIYLDAGGHTQDSYADATVKVGSMDISPAVVSSFGNRQASLYTYSGSGVVTLSPTVPDFSSGVNNSTVIVNGSASGGSYIGIACGTVHLFGTGNIVNESSAGAQPMTNAPYTTITGWTSADSLILASTGGGQPYAFYSPSSSSPIQGGAVYGYHSSTPQSVIYVGNVGGGTPTEVAVAANKVYIPNDAWGEAAIFYGQTSTGGTAIYDWLNYTTAPAGADTHNDHTVHADNFAGGVILVGVAASSFNASFFERF